MDNHAPSFASRLKVGRRRLHYLWRTRHLIWEACRWWTLLWTTLLIFNGVVPIVLVWITRVMVDALVVFVETAGANFSDVVMNLVVFVLLSVLRVFASNIIEWINIVQSENLQDYVAGRLHAHVNQLGVDFFDHPRNHNRLFRARLTSKSRPFQLLQGIGALMQNSITLVGLLALLVSYSSLLPFIVSIIAIPLIMTSTYYANRLNKWRIAATSRERKANYFDFLITTMHYASELRVFGLGHHFAQSYAHLRDGLRQERLRLERNRIFATLAALLVNFIATGIIMGWMGYQVLRGLLSFGDLAAFYQIFNQGQHAMRYLLQNVMRIYQSSLYLEDYFELIDTPVAEDSREYIPMIDLPLSEGIRFENIAFQYPGSEVEVLKNFNWDIPAGKIVALVGENGEGKSTLMKLLCRLYQPNAGRVLWDGIDLQQLQRADIFRAVTILFQSPLYYAGTAYENIALGDVTEDFSQSEIENAAQQAGLHKKIVSLPQSYQTLIGKAFGGEEFSGGQWQRLALARAFIREASIIVLDEPTSAMDSWAEVDWLKRLRDFVDNQIVIMITHRFTTAMQADLIYVIENGQITEQGTHEVLLAADGHYAKSWQAQMHPEHQFVE